jgi:RNA polymerase sigma-70 factor (ECF subfamily)
VDVNEAYEVWTGSEGQARTDALEVVYEAAKQFAKNNISSDLKGRAPELADEIAVDVVMGIEGFRGDSKFSTWVMRIIRNKRADHIRSAKDKDKIIVKLPRMFGRNEENEDSWYQRMGPKKHIGDLEKSMEAYLDLEKVKDLVPPEDRPLFDAVFVEGMTHSKAAEVLGMTTDAVESAKRRLKAKVQKKVEKIK